MKREHAELLNNDFRSVTQKSIMQFCSTFSFLEKRDFQKMRKSRKRRDFLEEIKMKNSPYFVQYSDNVKQAIEYALSKDLLKIYCIPNKTIQDYFNKKKELPIWIVEAACKLNLQDIKIPAQYQYLWFCLHNTILRRKQPSGREFKTKVNFASCYVKQDKPIKELLKKACKILNLPLYKFSVLCGYKKAIAKHKKVMPLLALLKICQILRINIWDLLQDKELFGKTSRIGKITIPINQKYIELIILLIWLETEGHLELGSTHIEINQKDSTTSLKNLKQIILKKFKLRSTHSAFPKGKRGEDRLIISSSPLRQFLCLREQIPIGYKSGLLQSMHLERLSKEECIKILPAFVQTEGCLTYCYTRNKKKKLPRFEFIVKDEALANDCLITLKKSGFNPVFSQKQNIFKVALYNSKKVIDLVYQIEPYVFDDKKIKYLKKVCTHGIGL